MINLTRLLCGIEQPADHMRYGLGHGAAPTAAQRRPIVVWNITRRCNLRCVHCYSNSDSRHYPGELDWTECRAVINDLADFHVPALLFSGGEPMIHPLFFFLARYAAEAGMRLTLSTNGTLIDEKAAEKLRAIGFSYVGISLDGIGPTHDKFRGRTGAFDKAVNAFRNCRAVGQKVGLRLTLTRQTVEDLDQILDFIEEEGIQRVCFYHLVYSGRGADVTNLPAEATRQALDKIMNRVELWHRNGDPREVLTVDQPADSAYVWMRLGREDNERAQAAEKLLRWNGGGANGSGIGLANIDSQGFVHPDQFWQTHSLGNVRQKPFSEIWRNSNDPLLQSLRSNPRPVKGRCARCKFFGLCGGGFRVRAWQRYGDPMAEDPGCYLSEQEITA